MLSVGERQSISIARDILKYEPIIIPDELTSGLIVGNMGIIAEIMEREEESLFL